MEKGGGNNSETGSVMAKEKKSITGFNANLTPDFRDKEQSNILILFSEYWYTSTRTTQEA